MKKKCATRSGLFSLRLIVCATAVCLIINGTLLAFFRSEAPTKIPHATLTFVERVGYQRRIEEVYWRHRIWPKENSRSKPSLDEVMSAQQIEKKVDAYTQADAYCQANRNAKDSPYPSTASVSGTLELRLRLPGQQPRL